ncbi:MAG: nucleoside kinase [Oscillospiraceae bacterium]
MSEPILRTVKIRNKTAVYPDGTTYETIARDYQSGFDSDILLVRRNGKLRELPSPLDRDCTLEFLTAKDRPGYQTYERSVILLFLKAFYDIVGSERIERVCVDHSASHALFIRTQGDFTPDADLLAQVEARMHELVAAALPIRKRVMDVDDVIELFRERRMPEKADLFRYRASSQVSTYDLDGFVDYFYGYMLPNTRYIQCFALSPAGENGLFLHLPAQENPAVLGDFTPSQKVFRAQCEVTMRFEHLGIPSVSALNGWIANDKATEMILAQEALMEKQIGDIAQQIAAQPDVRFVMIAGPSSSGKTTFSHRLSTQLRACGLIPHPIATDNYFVDRDKTPVDENGNHDFECLEAMDVDGFNRDMLNLLHGETVEMPQYNFKKGVREYNGSFLTLGENDILVIEGIHCLNDRFTYALPPDNKFKIYISCLTTLNIDDHNRIPTTDARLLRRIERDARTRGYSASATIGMWPSVRRGEERHIFPYQDSADVVFNSALIYETSLLRPYIEPLLYGIERDDPAYTEARRLIKFLGYFLPIPADVVPLSSIAREFIGGSCYNV